MTFVRLSENYRAYNVHVQFLATCNYVKEIVCILKFKVKIDKSARKRVFYRHIEPMKTKQGTGFFTYQTIMSSVSCL